MEQETLTEQLPHRDFYGNFLYHGNTVVRREGGNKPNRKGRIGFSQGDYYFIHASGDLKCQNVPINTEEDARLYIKL